VSVLIAQNVGQKNTAFLCNTNSTQLDSTRGAKEGFYEREREREKKRKREKKRERERDLVPDIVPDDPNTA